MKRSELIELLLSLRIDAILEESDEFDQDELAEMLATLGVEEYK